QRLRFRRAYRSISSLIATCHRWTLGFRGDFGACFSRVAELAKRFGPTTAVGYRFFSRNAPRLTAEKPSEAERHEHPNPSVDSKATSVPGTATCPRIAHRAPNTGMAIRTLDRHRKHASRAFCCCKRSAPTTMRA